MFLRLNGNQFNEDAPFPESLYDASRLVQVRMNNCRLTGNLTAGIGNWVGDTPAYRGITQLQLAGNNLGGVLPEELADLTALVELQLQGNGFSGPIPAAIGDLEGLEVIDLSENSLEGPIPESFGQLVNLQSVSLLGNSLTGALPESIGNLDKVCKLSPSFVLLIHAMA